ncbi:MAG: AraC family transcriptional regulator [Chitinophagales bacterium]|nr:AraC family transcriptional regulator [Chitinophagaceae bacterium]MCB9064714.1 AraC family transcriptional regulator [Chitinophagales bacterium]
MITDSKANYVELPDPMRMLTIESLNYKNPYNHKQLHRHDYFEIILVNEGEGSQIIDFDVYPMAPSDVFIIYPGQTHLMQRNDADGMLIQFRKDIFEYIHPLKHYSFYTKSTYLKPKQDEFDHLLELTKHISKIFDKSSVISNMDRHKAFSYLQIILITLIEQQEQKVLNTKAQALLTEYIHSISDNIYTLHKVAEHAEKMHCTPDKLNEVSKQLLGKTALELIHEELILETRRLMLLNELTLKEIAFELNFDTQGNFNAFIKSKTGMTPKELQASVQKIYN